MTVLLVALGAAVGAPLRYLIGQWAHGRLGGGFPWGTLAANVTGSFLLGFLIARQTSPIFIALVGTGFCGALTTYSTFSWEVLTAPRPRSTAYAVISVTGALGAVSLGFMVAGLGRAG